MPTAKCACTNTSVPILRRFSKRCNRFARTSWSALHACAPGIWLADRCEAEGLPFVLGHALSMRAIHGGKAKNDRLDSHNIAALLRGGLMPQAYVYPRRMRATRDL